MGQTPSTPTSSSSSASTRLDNASTRTLHSTSLESHRPVSFFKRISNRLHVTHSARRFGRSRTNNGAGLNSTPADNNHNRRANPHYRPHQYRHSNSSYTSSSRNNSNLRNTLHTSSASITSSVRRATQEAARSAAAATGPPAFTSFLIQPPSSNANNNSGSRNSFTSSSTYDNTNFLSDLLSSPLLRDSISIHSSNTTTTNNRHHNSNLHIPSRIQENETTTANDVSNSGVQSSASSTSTARRMHILVIEYRPNNSSTAQPNDNRPVPSTNIRSINASTVASSTAATSLEPLTPPPTYRFLGLRRPRSEVSTTSSTETIQSMPLSMNSTQTNTRSMMSNNNNTANSISTSMSLPSQSAPLQASSQQQSSPTTTVDGQWIVYVLNPNSNNSPSSITSPTSTTNNTTSINGQLQALSSSLVLDDNPSYEDLLWLTNILGPARPNTATQQAVDEAIPIISWSNDTKEELKDYQCLVCLDEFALKQPVRVLKCHHVFHRECVDRWLCEAHNSCPVCRGVPV